MIDRQLAALKCWITRPYTAIDIVAAVVAVAVGVLVFRADAPLADKLIGLFGVLTVVLRADSRLSFGVALICLVNIPLVAALSRQQLAESIAVYAFYFLVIGVIDSLLEIQPEREYATRRRTAFEPIAKINRQEVALPVHTAELWPVHTTPKNLPERPVQHTPGSVLAPTVRPKKKVVIVSG